MPSWKPKDGRLALLVIYMAIAGTLTYIGEGASATGYVSDLEVSLFTALAIAAAVLALTALPVWLFRYVRRRRAVNAPPRYIDACASATAMGLALLICMASAVGTTNSSAAVSHAYPPVGSTPQRT